MLDCEQKGRNAMIFFFKHFSVHVELRTTPYSSHLPETKSTARPLSNELMAEQFSDSNSHLSSPVWQRDLFPPASIPRHLGGSGMDLHEY